MCLILKTFQTVVSTSMTIQFPEFSYVIFGGFLLFGTLLGPFFYFTGEKKKAAKATEKAGKRPFLLVHLEALD
jgi:hypothetical protein